MTSPSSRPPTPAPLTTAAGLAFVQGLVVLGGAALEARSLSGERVAVGLSTTAFFLIYGVVLVWCAWSLQRLKPWARGPVLMTQIVCLGLAWSLRGYWPVSAALVVSAAVVLAGLLHPRSMEVLEEARHES